MQATSESEIRQLQGFVQESSLKGAHHALRDLLASPVGAIARSREYVVSDFRFLQGALHFEVQDPAGLVEGSVLHHWESGLSNRIDIISGNTVRLEKAIKRDAS